MEEELCINFVAIFNGENDIVIWYHHTADCIHGVKKWYKLCLCILIFIYSALWIVFILYVVLEHDIIYIYNDQGRHQFCSCNLVMWLLSWDLQMLIVLKITQGYKYQIKKLHFSVVPRRIKLCLKFQLSFIAFLWPRKLYSVASRRANFTKKSVIHVPKGLLLVQRLSHFQWLTLLI